MLTLNQLTRKVIQLTRHIEHMALGMSLEMAVPDWETNKFFDWPEVKSLGVGWSSFVLEEALIQCDRLLS